jgi:hypothetical protein
MIKISNITTIIIINFANNDDDELYSRRVSWVSWLSNNTPYSITYVIVIVAYYHDYLQIETPVKEASY